MSNKKAARDCSLDSSLDSSLDTGRPVADSTRPSSNERETSESDGSESKPDLSRRQFLVRSAGVAGVSVGLGVRARAAHAADNSPPLNIALVGAGQRGMKLLSVLRDQTDAEVVAVVDPHPRRRGNARRLVGDQARLFSDLDGLMSFSRSGCADENQVDAVFIASPPAFHRQQALVALEAGWHVYLEKPLALTVEDCDAVLRAALDAEDRGQVFQVGFQRRYSPSYQASVASIHRGEAGPAPFVRAQWHAQGESASHKRWIHDPTQSGGQIVEQASHQLDVFNWMFDSPPERAYGFGGGFDPSPTSPGRALEPGNADPVGLLLEYPHGGRVLLSHVTFAVPDRRFAGVHELVFGERVGIELGSGRAWDRRGRPLHLLDAPPSQMAADDTRIAVEGFVSHIRRGEHPLASARTGHRATVTALFCRAALQSRQVLTWDDFLAL